MFRSFYMAYYWQVHLSCFILFPPGNYWLVMIALGCFEFSIGGLIVFLAGLIAVDVMPKSAAGAVKGVIGLFSVYGSSNAGLD